MRLPWQRTRERPVPRSLAEARQERAAAERRLAEARTHVIIPLRQMREENHVFDAVTALIQRRVDQGG